MSDRAIDVTFKNHCRTVWVDLDATLAEYSHWEGVYAIGMPIRGAKDFMSRLRAFCMTHGLRIGIFTTRTHGCYPGREDVLNRNQWASNEDDVTDCLVNIVESWLRKHEIPFDEVYSGPGKPIGVCYVDDRGVNCRPQVDGAGAYDAAFLQVKLLAKK